MFHKILILFIIVFYSALILADYWLSGNSNNNNRED